MNKERQ